jgi:hypothetical protein
MKAYLKLLVTYFSKSGIWLFTLALSIVYLWMRSLTDTPVFVPLVSYAGMVAVTAFNRASEKSGFSRYALWFPLPVKEKIKAQYIFVFSFSLISLIILLNGGYWTRILLWTYPCLPLLAGAADQPWDYMNAPSSLRLAVKSVFLVLLFFLFSALREMPLAASRQPLWFYVLINLAIVLVYILSACLSVYFAKKRGVRS